MLRCNAAQAAEDGSEYFWSAVQKERPPGKTFADQEH
jgi:hypothetical protein